MGTEIVILPVDGRRSWHRFLAGSQAVEGCQDKLGAKMKSIYIWYRLEQFSPDNCTRTQPVRRLCPGQVVAAGAGQLHHPGELVRFSQLPTRHPGRPPAYWRDAALPVLVSPHLQAGGLVDRQGICVPPGSRRSLTRSSQAWLNTPPQPGPHNPTSPPLKLPV